MKFFIESINNKIISNTDFNKKDFGFKNQEFDSYNNSFFAMLQSDLSNNLPIEHKYNSSIENINQSEYKSTEKYSKPEEKPVQNKNEFNENKLSTKNENIESEKPKTNNKQLGNDASENNKEVKLNQQLNETKNKTEPDNQKISNVKKSIAASVSNNVTNVGNTENTDKSKKVNQKLTLKESITVKESEINEKIITNSEKKSNKSIKELSEHITKNTDKKVENKHIAVHNQFESTIQNKKQLLKKNIKNNIEENSHIVSRETINLKARHLIKDFGLEKELNLQNHLHKSLRPEKDLDQLKNIKNETQNNSFNFFSNLNSSAKTFHVQNDMFSPARLNLQQQLDSILSQAKVQIKENGNANLSATLYPKELGKVNVKLFLIDGTIQGQMTVDNETVQKEIISRLDKAFENLKQDGFEISNFHVNVRSDNSNEAQNNFELFDKNNQIKKNNAEYKTSEIITEKEQKKEGIYA
ncbi:MAG: flagellar hook-length control protein FliK [Spirochaetia bacterium]|nr:flagellar hook-length control protein FliK [Spirochaetia bacterium]